MSRDASNSSNQLRSSVDSHLTDKRFNVKQSLIKPATQSLNTSIVYKQRPTSSR